MIYSIFKDKVERFPDHTGFVLEDGRRLTYTQADLVVDTIAAYLSSLGVKAGDRVGVMLEFESLHPFVFYALDKLNASYIPFDLNMPEGQLKTDVDKLNLDFFISPSLRGEVGNDPRQCERSEAIQIPRQCELSEAIQEKQILDCFVGVPPRNDDISLPPRDNTIPVYLVASSGTSDNKKWMGINGAALGYWEKTEELQLDQKPGHKVLCTRSPGYDARISEYLRALIAGGELHLISREQRRDLDYIIQYSKENKITEILLIASQLNVDNIESIIQQLAEGGLKNLIVTGDACRPKLKALCEKYGISLVNAYGPTEACFGVSLIIVNGMILLDEKGNPVVPIGLPMGDEIIMHLVEGRVYIESPYLITGYIDNPEATAKNFKIMNINGRTVRVFDTGDRADLVDGKLRFKGRDDDSDDCKINGVKVDKHDIENQLIRLCSEDPAFTNAVVVSKVIDGVTRLVAYLVTKPGKPGFDGKSLNKRLRRELLPEQIPALISLPELPILTVSQKIDKQALIQRTERPEEYLLSMSLQSPDSVEVSSDPIIRTLRSYWKDLLGFESPSDQEAFSDLGAKSIDFVRLVSKIRAGLNRKITMLDLLKLNKVTIESLYGLLTKPMDLGEREGPIQAIISPLSGPVDQYNKNIYILPHLLGDGGIFSYKKLAESIKDNRPDVNILGLTDPGIYDDSLINKTFDQMIDQYVNAILNNESEGPHPKTSTIGLAGFSYGCFLAMHVAHRLKQKGYRINEIQLVDGFPPLYFQKTTLTQHQLLMLDFYKFIAGVLKGELYGESIDVGSPPDLSAFGKMGQIDGIFDSLIRQSKNPMSISMLRIAKQHLQYMLIDKEPIEQHISTTRLYFSRPDQSFFTVLNEMKNSSFSNESIEFGFWNHYFSNISKCSDIAECNHLEVIKEKAKSSLFFKYSSDKDLAWQISRDMFKIQPVAFIEEAAHGLAYVTLCHLPLMYAKEIKRCVVEQKIGCGISIVKQGVKNSVYQSNMDRCCATEYVVSTIVDQESVQKLLKIATIYCPNGIKVTRDCRLVDTVNQNTEQEEVLKFIVHVKFFSVNGRPTKLDEPFFWGTRSLFLETKHECAGDLELAKRTLFSRLSRPGHYVTIDNNVLTINWTISNETHKQALNSVTTASHEISSLIMPYILANASLEAQPRPIPKEFFSKKLKL